MTHKKITVPAFKFTEVNAGEDSKNAAFPQVFVKEMEAAMLNFEKISTTDNAIYIFIREKMDNGQFKYGIMVTPTENDDSIAVECDSFKKLPPIFFNVKTEVIKIVRKVMNNLAFS
jgi:hypothetical protein